MKYFYTDNEYGDYRIGKGMPRYTMFVLGKPPGADAFHPRAAVLSPLRVMFPLSEFDEKGHHTAKQALPPLPEWTTKQPHAINWSHCRETFAAYITWFNCHGVWRCPHKGATLQNVRQ